MKTENKKSTIYILLIVLGISTLILYSKNNDFIVKTSNKNIVVSEKKWNKAKDSQSYAKNFEAREKINKEEYPQMITVYLNPMTSDRMSGTKISNKEYLEIFVVHPKTVTIQIRNDKGNYWVLSRQTFSANEPELEKNPSLYQYYFQNEIDTTRHMLESEF